MVSVIVPVFNSIKFLKISVDSILSHSLVGEILLIEDGSTDHSLELCYLLKESDSRIRVFTHAQGRNRGAAESRNLGILNAKFPYIAFLDSDDVYFENRFEHSIFLLEKYPEVSGCYGKVLINYSNQNCKKLMGVSKIIYPDQLFNHLLNGGYFHTNSITIRKSFLEKIGGFNQKCWPHEDIELWIRMAFYGNLISIESEVPIAEYKVHGTNLSTSANWKSKWNLWLNVYNNFFFKNISNLDRLFILKQLFKVFLLKLKLLK